MTQSLDELFAQEEAQRLAQARKDIAAEKAAYDALPQEEKDRLWALSEAKWAAFDDACKAPEAEAEEGDDAEEDEDDPTEE